MPITAGSVSLVRRMNMGDYSFKEGTKAVHYTIEPNENPTEVAEEACRLALIQLTSTLETKVEVTEPLVIDLGGATEPKKRHRRTKAEIEAEKAAEAVVPGPLVETPPADPTPAFAAAPVGAGSSTVSSGTEVGGSEITDKELNNACNETMNRIKNKVAIQAVIQQYTDGNVATIPAHQRSAFLVMLHSLKP